MDELGEAQKANIMDNVATEEAMWNEDVDLIENEAVAVKHSINKSSEDKNTILTNENNAVAPFNADMAQNELAMRDNCSPKVLQTTFPMKPNWCQKRKLLSER